jgi:PAS domain S-box-containing protein
MTDPAIPPERRVQRLEQLLDASSEGICEVDGQGRCTFINPAGARILGLDVETVVGRPFTEIMQAHRFDGRTRTAPADPLDQALQTRETMRGIETVFWRADGEAVRVMYSVVPHADPEVPGAVIAFADNSKLARLEKELQERTAEIVQAERRRIEFIATLAHELRNPLAPLSAALQIMHKASDSATSLAQVRELMERQVGQMVHLVNDLLDLARETSGQLRLHKERVALQEILQLAIEASAPLMRAGKNPLTLDIPETPLCLHADKTRLTQALTNILNNAAQYSTAGSPISVRVETRREDVQIDIADAGVGIAREALNRIFDMFTQVGRETQGTHAGLGIGLNLARRWVEMHEGELVATSEGLGRGSHFLITLPLNTAHDESPRTEKLPPEGKSRNQVRVLLVDDNVDAAAALSLLLELGGHRTSIAHSGPEALRVVPDFKPEIVLLDLGLPGMDGYEVARAMRKMPELGRPILIAVTGWGAPEDRLKSKQAGFDEHLTKPVDISTIELLLTTLPSRARDVDGHPPVENGHPVDASPD